MLDAPITYARDDVRHRITVMIIGPAHLEGLTGVIERQAAEGTWGYALLYDERAVTEALSVDDTRTLVTLVSQLTLVHGPRGPVAIVCRTVDQFGMARMYSILAESRANLNSNVFYELAAAASWLDESADAPL